MGFLGPACCEGGVLRHPGQIGIEVAVQQPRGPRRKQLVCKDLVIWAEPFMTVWGPDRKARHHLLCILEWKRQACDALNDREWLQEYSKYAPTPFVGFSVAFDTDVDHGVVRVARISTDKIMNDRLTAP